MQLKFNDWYISLEARQMCPGNVISFQFVFWCQHSLDHLPGSLFIPKVSFKTLWTKAELLPIDFVICWRNVNPFQCVFWRQHYLHHLAGSLLLPKVSFQTIWNKAELMPIDLVISWRNVNFFSLCSGVSIVWTIFLVACSYLFTKLFAK